jgi:hypothetical protein
MPPAEGNFNQNLELLWGGKGVAARGPVEWGDEGASAVLHVAIMQDTVAATGRTGDDLTRVADEFLIAATVQGDGTLTPGPAIATGLALGQGDKGPEMYQWSVPVTLTGGPSADALEADLSQRIHEPAKKARAAS